VGPTIECEEKRVIFGVQENPLGCRENPPYLKSGKIGITQIVLYIHDI